MKTILSILLTCCILLPVYSQTNLYVNIANGNDSNDGTSWNTAFKNLNTALVNMEYYTIYNIVPGGTGGGNIYVAEGNYYPDEGMEASSDSKNATFELQNNVKIYGGYNSSGNGSRNVGSYKTYLNGDIDQDGSYGGNSYHIVHANSSVGSTARLDGFRIKGGNADNNGTMEKNIGGGFYFEGASPVINNCQIYFNHAIQDGGGVYVDGGSPTFSNCNFQENEAYDDGGAVICSGATVTFTNCTFQENEATDKGGGVYNENGSIVTFDNCDFTSNTCSDGGGVYNSESSDATFTDCEFSNNDASTGQGGGMASVGAGTITMSNCEISNNSASYSGAGLYFDGGSNSSISKSTITGNAATSYGGGGIRLISSANVTIKNSIFTGNNAPVGSAVCNNSAILNLVGCTVAANVDDTFYWEGSGLSFENTVVWGNGSSFNGSCPVSNVSMSNSLVQSVNKGGTNLNGHDAANNPRYISPPERITVGATGNFALQANSSLINRGNNSYNTYSKDFDGETRVKSDTIDIGAYEYQKSTYCRTPEGYGGEGLDFSNQDLDDVDFTTYEAGALAYANFQNADLDNANFTGVDLTGANFYDVAGQNIIFSGATLSGGCYLEAHLEDADMSNTMIDAVEFYDLYPFFDNVKFTAANLSNISFLETKLDNSDFQNAQLTNIQFNDDIDNCNFTDASLSNITFSDSDIDDSFFTNANLRNISFKDGRVTDNDFTNANLVNITFDKDVYLYDLVMVNTRFSGVDFSYQDLDHFDFGENINIVASGQRTRFNYIETEIEDFPINNLADSCWANIDLSHAVIKDISPENCDFGNRKMDGVIMNGWDLTGYNFAYTSLIGAQMDSVILDNANMNNVNLSNASLQMAQGFYLQLNDGILDYANLMGVNFSESSMENTTFNHASIESSTSPTNYHPVLFNNANLKNTDFSNSSIDNVNFSGADLSGTKMSDLTLFGTNFSEAQLPEANFSSSTMEGVDFSNTQMQGASFIETKLSQTESGLSMNFQCAQLGGVDFTNADISSTNFQNAIMIPQDSCCLLSSGDYTCGAISYDAQPYGPTIFPILQNEVTCPNGRVAKCTGDEWIANSWGATCSPENRPMWSKPNCNEAVIEDSSLYITFTDPNLGNCLIDRYFNGNYNYKITKVWAAEQEEIDISNYAITDLGGMEYFTSLKQLDASDNALSNGNFFQYFPLLETLNLNHNQYTAIALAQNCDRLKNLFVSNNELASLDLNSNIQLIFLDAADNLLTNFNLSTQRNIADVNLSYNRLTTIGEVTNLHQLQDLDLSHNNLTDIGSVVDFYCQIPAKPYLNLDLTCNPNFNITSLGFPTEMTTCQESAYDKCTNAIGNCEASYREANGK